MKVKKVLLEFMKETGMKFPWSVKKIEKKGCKSTPVLIDLFQKLLNCDDLSEKWRKELDKRLGELKKYQ